MPALEVFYEKYKANGFMLVGINQEETLEVVDPFVKEFALTFPFGWIWIIWPARVQYFEFTKLLRDRP